MNQFSLLRFTIVPQFKKQFLQITLLLVFFIATGIYAQAQCNNTTLSGTITAPSPGNTTQINACANAGDYSVINGVTSSTAYVVSSNISTDYLTIRQGTPGGRVIGYGKTPLTFTATSAGTYYLHVNLYYDCGTQATCRTTSIANNGVCVPPVITVNPAPTCGGICVPIAASGASTYTWFPFGGLYSDCTQAIPYFGGNASYLYVDPRINTTYTVTGTNMPNGCSGTTTVNVNYTPPIPNVFPNPTTICLGDPAVKLRVASYGALQYCSGAVNIPVPDNNRSGVSNSINVSGTPLDCGISSISVTINMAHSRVGDMVFVLKAPNGQIINLDYFISGTGGNGPTTGFVNTTIASNISNPLSSGSNPYTSTFHADMQTGTLAGPTGMVPTATNWANLFSTVNGTWTLGMYDGVSLQTGILNSWCLNLNFPCAVTGLPNATPGRWMPAAGLYTDPAATMAYIAGTAIDSVWARPTPAGTYTYQVTIGSLPIPSTCTSFPRSVVVTVGQPTTITTQPVNQNICIGNSASFNVTMAGVGPFNYQWQTSVGGAGGPWVNIINGGLYGGVLTNTLSIITPSIIMSGSVFRVIVNGGSGCSGATSNAALLTVNPFPTVVISANPLIVTPVTTTIIRSVVSPNPAAVYTWYYNGSVLVGATADTLKVDINGLGDYQLRVTDVIGCTGLSNIITITDRFSATLFVSPNPSSGLVYFRYYSTANNVVQRTVMVYSNRGDRIITKPFTQTIPYQKIEIDLRRNGKGLYWIELRDDKGKRLSIKSVIIQ